MKFSRFENSFLSEASAYPRIGTNPFSVERIYTDTRKIIQASNSVFVALSDQRDGHYFVEEAYQKGVRLFVIEKPVEYKEDANYFLVNSSLTFLQNWARNYRLNFSLPIVAITGSNGKTTLKEWIYHCLWKKFNLVRSPKSYNSQLGVALSVFGIQENHNLGVFEAGISLPKEMERLQEILRPKIAILLNVNSAHLEHFKDRKQLIDEKLNLCKSAQTILCGADDPEIYQAVKSRFSDRKVLFWANENASALQLKIVEKIGAKSLVRCEYNQKTYDFDFPFQDRASLENLKALVLLIFELGLNLEDYYKEISSLPSIEMRLEVIEGIQDSLLINDVYSSDLQSIEIALNALSEQPKKQKAVVITDLVEKNSEESVVYQTLSGLINAQKLEFLVLIGPEIEKHKSFFKAPVFCFDSTDKMLVNFDFRKFEKMAILLKGARKFELEKITDLLAKSSHDTKLEISFEAMKNNLIAFQSKLKPTTKTMCMVKAYSYGSGGAEIARFLEKQKVDYLGVAYANEGAEIRLQGVGLPIMVMNPEQNSYQTIIRHQLEPEIYSFRVLEKFHAALNKEAIQEPYPIHLKFDTGMNRLGFLKQDIENILKYLQNSSNLKVASIFSHMPSADNKENNEFNIKQIESFESIYTLISSRLGYKPIKHLLNSAGIVNYPSAHFDMVRLGLGLYGYCDQIEMERNLIPISSFKTVISQIRTIHKGETVGYGQRFVAQNTTKIAILPVGYADGINRRLSLGVGSVMIQGKKAPFIGSICMDMCMVDITHIDCQEGDQVLLFGPELSAREVAEKLQTIAYEVLTSVSSRVKRVYYH
ncbi:MAG: bifunctional UDP-N-acetylmuramoyl-tripeptide:D-alanyl-D-alanine ligase/alanine racemase [Flavobacteriaceae bacterium]|nr:MAG: bifunctional UDP-N-acetylmuramoyl-tripeptide:D-alanyl-D-alanine ligase/alanine racemase [Flavobacteriaceae bacterium]